MPKLDLKREWKELYSAPREPALIKVPPLNYAMIDGDGDPNNSPLFVENTQALYAISFALKFALKKSDKGDYAVMPLEGLWWMKANKKYDPADRANWLWTLMIVQPPPVTRVFFNKALEQVQAKKGLAALDRVRFEKLNEGRAVQLLHIGPYSAEEPNLKRIREFMAANGYKHGGKHHEIYLGDPRRAEPEKLKTILRQPVK